VSLIDRTDSIPAHLRGRSDAVKHPHGNLLCERLALADASAAAFSEDHVKPR
jgi:hypothetical protein